MKHLMIYKGKLTANVSSVSPLSEQTHGIIWKCASVDRETDNITGDPFIAMASTFLFF